MRAVNLIPSDSRRGGGGALGRSGGAAYVLLGALLVLVALVGSWAVASRNIDSRQTELAALKHDTEAARAQAATLASYDQFAQLRASRFATVRGLADARFDWSRTLDAVARTLPRSTRLTTLTGTIVPAVPAAAPAPATPPAGASSSTATPPPAPVATAPVAALPTIQIGGCSRSQRTVAELMPRLRSIPGVDSVKLVSSAVPESAAPGPTTTSSAAAADPATCTGATFAMVLAFASAGVPVSVPVAPGAAPAAPAPAAATPAAPAPAPATGAAK